MIPGKLLLMVFPLNYNYIVSDKVFEKKIQKFKKIPKKFNDLKMTKMTRTSTQPFSIAFISAPAVQIR
jgi:hypothetical protein